jgi:hypothetical protein
MVAIHNGIGAPRCRANYRGGLVRPPELLFGPREPAAISRKRLGFHDALDIGDGSPLASSARSMICSRAASGVDGAARR